MPAAMPITAPAPLPSPLIERLVAHHGYPRLDADTLDGFIAGGGIRVLFLTGDPAKNLETNDLAVILPELARAFPGQFQPGVVVPEMEQAMRERFGVWPLPSLVFLEGGEVKGAIAKLRDWDDYLTEIARILGASGPATPAATRH